MEDDSTPMRLFRECIEHIEVSFLKAVAQGPGNPAFTIYDLDDPIGLEEARKVPPAEQIEDALIDAAARGVAARLVYFQMLAAPYDLGQDWWKDTPPGRFPVAVVSDGQLMVLARLNPAGTDEALRRRLLVEHAAKAIGLAAECGARGETPVAVFISDARDSRGRQAAEASLGVVAVQAMLSQAGDERSVFVTAGIPNSKNYPDAWGGPIAPGYIAVQVVAYGGVLNEVISVAGN